MSVRAETMLSKLSPSISLKLKVFSASSYVFFSLIISVTFDSESQLREGESILKVVSDTKREMSDKCQ